MSHARLVLPTLLLAACSTPAVNSNLRMPGEPSTIARELTHEEREAAIDAMASAQPPAFEARPLEPAGERGRWREVREVVKRAVKSCEVAVVVDRPTKDGLEFDLRSINDEQGRLRVTGNEVDGVTGMQVEMGPFGDDRALADRITKAFERELRRYARIPRPQ